MDELIDIVPESGTSMDFSGLFGSMFGLNDNNSYNMQELMNRYMQFVRDNTDYNNAWSAEQAQKQMDFQTMSQQQAQLYNAEEAAKNRNWQEYMSSTAHQREIADLKAAGLNPVLSATGGNGAAVTSGATASSQAMSGSKGDGDQSSNSAITAILGSALNVMTTLASKTVDAQTSLAVADKYTEMERIIEAMREEYGAWEHENYPSNQWEAIASIVHAFLGDSQASAVGQTFNSAYESGAEGLPQGALTAIGTTAEHLARSAERSHGSEDKTIADMWKEDDVKGIFLRVARVLGEGTNGLSVMRGFIFNADYRRSVLNTLSAAIHKGSSDAREIISGLGSILQKYRDKVRNGDYSD